MNLCDKNLLSYIKQGASKAGSITGRPEIDRPILREILHNSLLPDTIKWSKKLLSVTRDAATGDMMLSFADGSTASSYDLVVGADGAWSRVRSFLSDAKPTHSGIAGHTFRIPDAETRHPDLYALVNRGSLFSWSDGRSIMAQYMGDGSLNIGTWAVHPANWREEEGHDVHDPLAVKARCRRDYADWHPALVELTQVADADTIAPRDLYMLPIGHAWAHAQGVTLIGDAAHLMTPFAGEGVNLALEDSLRLSRAIIRAAEAERNETERSEAVGRQALDAQIRAFEQDLFPRATSSSQLTSDMMHAMFFVAGAPRNGIEEYITRAVEGEFGYWATKLVLRPVVYAYFFVWKLMW